MMNGREKSDPAIVARKPTNKAGSPAAEPVERRAGAEGNADQRSTLRAQTRDRVTQALDRVRQAARQRKKERFTALLHHISVDTLRLAFYALKRKAAAGVDGVMWTDYEADLVEPRLEDLHGRIHRGAYRPQPSRRTYIPKADGKQRPLAVAAVLGTPAPRPGFARRTDAGHALTVSPVPASPATWTETARDAMKGYERARARKRSRVLIRWQLAHTTSHLAISASTRSARRFHAMAIENSLVPRTWSKSRAHPSPL